MSLLYLSRFIFKKIHGLVLVFSFSVAVVAQSAGGADLEGVESRIRAIYEEGEFRARSYRVEWLPDGSGYLHREPSAGENGSSWVRYDAASGSGTPVSAAERRRSQERSDRSPDGGRVLLYEGGGLSVRELESGQTIKLTRHPEGSAVSDGRASWSPDGASILFVRTDRSDVRMRSMLIPGDPSYPTVRDVRFARVGGAINQLSVGVVDAAGGEIRWLPLEVPSEGCYLGQVEWAGNADEVLVEKRNRFRNEREFLLFNVRSGAVRSLFRESDPAWVVASIRKNAGLAWIRDGRAFIVLSEKDGWRHAYLCSRDGRDERLLTPGDFDIIEWVKIDEERGWYYFNASPDNGTQKYLYRVNLDGGGGLERVTPIGQPGTHDYEFSPDAGWAIHTYSAFDTPPVTELVRFPKHESVRTLEDNLGLRKKIEGQMREPAEFLQLEIDGGVTMDAWMIKPAGFDPDRKYPVLVYVYGEPHAQTVLDAWGKVHAEYHRTVADLGYLVVSIDNRGTPAPKGAAWRRAVFGSLGPLSTEEQALGLQELGRRRSYVDLSRVGIWGWSGGGSNTLNAMFRRPDVYHVGIAVAPKPQAHLYNAWFQEIYMETRETNPEGYRKASAINFAEGLEGDLLIVHGSGETNTHLEIVEGLVDRLIELGKPFDFMVYPNRDHGIRKGKGTSVHLRMHMIRYLLDQLPAGPR